jgi:CBS domain-containing protein
MKARDVMTRHVITIAPDASILEALRLMLQHRISGLPVVDKNGTVAGIVTEGDFLRRAETGTQRKRPRWVEFLLGPGMLAKDYVQAHARRIDEVMTTDVRTVPEDAELAEVVAVMEKHRVKRVPVMRGTALVGIVSRANLLHALANLSREVAPSPKTDDDPRRRACRIGSPVLGAATHDRCRRPQRARRIVGHGHRSRAARCRARGGRDSARGQGREMPHRLGRADVRHGVLRSRGRRGGSRADRAGASNPCSGRLMFVRRPRPCLSKSIK